MAMLRALPQYDICIGHPTLNDSDSIHALESASFPHDEAASKNTIEFRLRNANPYFLILKFNNNIIGFINGTCSEKNAINASDMTSHSEKGSYLILHSVTISSEFRRKGLGVAFLIYYINYITDSRPEIKEIFLLTKANLITFYSKSNFQFSKQSEVSHGQDIWYEMKLNIHSQRYSQYQIDAFCTQAFKGNPAAVILKHDTNEWMQLVAKENNLSETAFLKKLEPHSNKYLIRWFTPSVEVELCGHATLASTHALMETQRIFPGDIIIFETLYSGTLTVKVNEDRSYEMTFPSVPCYDTEQLLATHPQYQDDIEILATAFHLSSKDSILYYSRSIYDVLIEISIEDFIQLQSISINYALLKQITGRGILVTCLGPKYHHSPSPSSSVSVNNTDSSSSSSSSSSGIPLLNKEIDFFSRCFFPNAGIDEDPVTGSAHCTLLPYWHNKLSTTTTPPPPIYASLYNSSTVLAYQASPRGGYLKLSLAKDTDDVTSSSSSSNSSSGEKVKISGSCVTTIKSQLLCY